VAALVLTLNVRSIKDKRPDIEELNGLESATSQTVVLVGIMETWLVVGSRSDFVPNGFYLAARRDRGGGRASEGVLWFSRARTIVEALPPPTGHGAIEIVGVLVHGVTTTPIEA